ncbi:MAG: heavy-metal-associated domain-containing protein, partial [Anaerolineales bacterium]|nr:heavy-metal-associated domain-containing protein [Anaerolineales bacterium]
MTTQSEKQISLPVTGMTCANCVAAVERNTKKVDGVADAVVNFASEKVLITYDPALATPQAMIERIQRAGYDVPTANLELPISGMTCANCANTIQRRLNKTDGVLEASVNYANEKAVIRYVPGAVTRSELVAAVRKAGYDVIEAADDADLEDAEAAAR